MDGHCGRENDVEITDKENRISNQMTRTPSRKEQGEKRKQSDGK